MFQGPPRDGPLPKNREVIGIVGGFGPFAHISFETLLLDMARTRYGADADQDFPAWLLSSYTETPDRVRYILANGADALPGLIASFRRLEPCTTADGQTLPGADFAILTCITAHHLLPKILPHIRIPVLNMVDLTAEVLAQSHPGSRVAVLGTTATARTRLFDQALARLELTPVNPLDLPGGETVQRELIMGAIYGSWNPDGGAAGGIKGCGVTEQALTQLGEATEFLRDAGQADVIIAGCTEIDCAIHAPQFHGLAAVSPYRITAQRALERLYRLSPTPAIDTA